MIKERIETFGTGHLGQASYPIGLGIHGGWAGALALGISLDQTML
jgi:hypothetical protein